MMVIIVMLLRDSQVNSLLGPPPHPSPSPSPLHVHPPPPRVPPPRARCTRRPPTRCSAPPRARLGSNALQPWASKGMALPREEFWGIRLSADAHGLQGVAVVPRDHPWLQAARGGGDAAAFRALQGRAVEQLVAAPALWGRRRVQQVRILHARAVLAYARRDAPPSPPLPHPNPLAMPFLDAREVRLQLRMLRVGRDGRRLPWQAVLLIVQYRGWPAGQRWLPLPSPGLR